METTSFMRHFPSTNFGTCLQIFQKAELLWSWPEDRKATLPPGGLLIERAREKLVSLSCTRESLIKACDGNVKNSGSNRVDTVIARSVSDEAIQLYGIVWIASLRSQ